MSSRHPRAHESAARRAQLDRIKAERRARRESRPTRLSRAGGSFAPIGLNAPAPPTWAQFIAEIRRLSMGGVMPDADRFDDTRPAHWPAADALCARFGVSWRALADDLGLTERRRV